MGRNEVLVHAHWLVVGQQEAPEPDQGRALLQLQLTGQKSAGADLLEAQDLGGRDHAAALHLFAVGGQLYLEIQFGFAHKRAQPHDALDDFLAHKGIDGLADGHPGQAEALGEVTLGRQRGTRRAGGTDVRPQDFPQLHVDWHPALAVDLADHLGRVRGRHGQPPVGARRG